MKQIIKKKQNTSFMKYNGYFKYCKNIICFYLLSVTCFDVAIFKIGFTIDYKIDNKQWF